MGSIGHPLHLELPISIVMFNLELKRIDIRFLWCGGNTRLYRTNTAGGGTGMCVVRIGWAGRWCRSMGGHVGVWVGEEWRGKHPRLRGLLLVLSSLLLLALTARRRIFR